jgi:cyanophycinase
MKLKLILLLPFFWCISARAQNGKLLLIGGGAENISSTTSWNYEAFNWAVAQSANKKVAILHYETTTTSDFENYFRNSCGATAVKSFIVNGTGASNAALVNEISEYDVFYFRGGDQWQYYSLWKGKLIEDAIHTKFSNGGVICGTSAGLAILSGTLFTAQNGECYSNGAVKNTNLITITLKNDFLEMMPGFVFDSHFTNRGRMGRLVSFMANWKNKTGEIIVGIGVDEITALAIGSNGSATAYGAGTVNIYRLSENSTFATATVLAVDSLETAQLSHGKTINLNDFEVGGFTNDLVPEETIETFSSKIYISGGDILGTANTDLLTKFAVEGTANDPIIVFTGTETTLAQSYKVKLNELGASNVTVYQATSVNANNSEIATSIQATSKFLFINNSSTVFIPQFFNSTGVAGAALKNAFQSRILTLAFIGDNARFCGQKVLGNYITDQANASISEGLALLKTAVIIPKTFERPASGTVTTYWHGTNSAIPYAMVKQEIKNGIWLNDDNYIIFKGDDGLAKFTVYGTSPVIVLSQHNTKGELVTQTYSGTGTPDKKGAFDFMYLSFLKANQEYVLGEYVPSITGISNNIETSSISIYPNPANKSFFIKADKEIRQVFLYDIIGSKKYAIAINSTEVTIDIEKLNLPKGVYFIKLITYDSQIFTRKIVLN